MTNQPLLIKEEFITAQIELIVKSYIVFLILKEVMLKGISKEDMRRHEEQIWEQWICELIVYKESIHE